MIEEAAWVALGVAATLFGAFIMHRLGFIQISIARQAHTLNVVKSAPKIGTEVHVDKRQENPSGFPAFYYLIATVYNEGELPAKQLKGHWKMHSPTKSIQEQYIPISADFLGSTPLKLQSHRLDDGISGTPIDLAGSGAQNIRIYADFELDYVAISDEQTHHYNAHYQYDHTSKQMIRT